jgi:hypothetical protein
MSDERETRIAQLEQQLAAKTGAERDGGCVTRLRPRGGIPRPTRLATWKASRSTRRLLPWRRCAGRPASGRT